MPATPHVYVADWNGDCAWCPFPARNRIHTDPAQPRMAPVAPEVPRVSMEARGTSLAAVAKAAPRQGTLRARLLDLIAARPGGATDDELEALTGGSHQSISACRNSLMRDGLIVAATHDDGAPVTRLNRRANAATVWITAVDARDGAA